MDVIGVCRGESLQILRLFADSESTSEVGSKFEFQTFHLILILLRTIFPARRLLSVDPVRQLATDLVRQCESPPLVVIFELYLFSVHLSSPVVFRTLSPEACKKGLARNFLVESNLKTQALSLNKERKLYAALSIIFV